jgi:hypothetical protein
MATDIEKLAVFDSRIVQSRPKYAVEKGALSLTNAPFNAIAATTSQHTYNIYVPSENVFVDRALAWSSTCHLQANITLPAGAAAGDAIAVPGRDFALTAFPLNSICSTMSATINDTTAVINTQDVLTQVLRLADFKHDRLQRTCPTMLDKYQSYDDAFGTLNNPLGAYNDATAYDEVPNGAFAGLVFTAPDGTPLGTASPAFGGALYDAVNGVPVAGTGVFPSPAAPAPGAVLPIYVRFRSNEKLVLSPFVFADEHEWDTGLFGINNIQLIMNLVSSPSRVLRSCTRAGRVLSAVAYNASAPNVFVGSRVNVQFLTPSLDIPLPPKSVVPYMEFPRYLSDRFTCAGGGAVTQLTSQTITLPQIPDLLIIFARPVGTLANTFGDYLLPLNYDSAQTVSPLSINFDNFSGLLSSHTTEELYAMSVKNGLLMDFNSWIGRGHTSAGPYGSVEQGQLIPLVGGPLVLKPSQDITLQAGQAPSLVGNFTLQFRMDVRNYQAAAVDAQLVIITVNSGFLESIRGSSRIIKGVLSEQDVISAPLAPMGVRASLDRVVGGLSFKSLGNILSKARDVYHATKPAVSAVKGMLSDEGTMGKIKGALGAVGYGEHGGAAIGAGMGAGIGAGRRGAKKSLAARLM